MGRGSPARPSSAAGDGSACLQRHEDGVPARALALVPGSGPYVGATGLAAPLVYGTTVAVRFTFAGGSSAEIAVPMAPHGQQATPGG